MFPVSDVIPSRTTPYVTIGLIAVNTVAFFYEFRMTPGELQALVDSYGVVPAAFSWPTLVTSLFLHAGWVHFLGNMLYLWIFGDNVEDRLGHAGFLLFYVSCGAAAASGHLVAHAASDVPLIGASGAVAGVMGAYFVLYPRSRVLTAVFLVVFLDVIEIPAVYFLGIWFLMQLFSGVGSIGADIADGTVAFWAHIAGFVAGGLTGLLLRIRRGAAAGYWRQARQSGE
jgi:membrane associated rhomboid family serine protease